MPLLSLALNFQGLEGLREGRQTQLLPGQRERRRLGHARKEVGALAGLQGVRGTGQGWAPGLG